MAGLILAKLSPYAVPPLPLLASSIFVLAASTLLGARWPAIWSTLLTLGLCAAGIAHYELRRERLPEWDELPTREARMTVRITRVFHTTDPEHFSGLGTVMASDPHVRDLLRQKVAVSVALEKRDVRPVRGSLVELVGVLEALPRRPPPNDPFLAYLIDGGVNFRLGRGYMVSTVEPLGRYAQWREGTRAWMSHQLGLGLERHPSVVAAFRGMLLGERQGLTARQEDLYLRTGAMHLFSISGLHVGAIAAGIIGLLRAMRLPPLGTLIASGLVLLAYVDITGLLPSAVRAWLMVMCFHAAVVFRAPGNSVSALGTSALIVLLIDPMQLFGAGFQMSYGIVAALLLYGVPMQQRGLFELRRWRPELLLISRRWQRLTRWGLKTVLTMLAINVAATVVGTAAGVGFFEVLSPIGLLANLLLIPLATITLFAGLLSIVAALGSAAPLVLLFNHAAGVVLLLMQKILEVLVRIPGASFPAEFRTPWLASTTLAVLVAVMGWGYARRWIGYGGFWLPPAVLGGFLLFGIRWVGN